MILVKRFILLVFVLLFSKNIFACTILYFIDSKSNQIYFLNNEDYWYDTKSYIQIVPSSKNELGRMWYGWDNFGQGGVNEKGLVIDGATTPHQKTPEGYSSSKMGNLTDDLLASCHNVEDAIQYLENRRIALDNAHILIGDKNSKAVIIEWVDGDKNIIKIANNRLLATNFNISDTNTLENKCWRYEAINNGLNELTSSNKIDTIGFKSVANVMAKAVQVPQKDEEGKIGGTLYTSFINITEMKLILVYQLDNSKIYNFDILKELQTGKSRKIKLK